jgi:molybdopterin biosynthesis enzyme
MPTVNPSKRLLKTVERAVVARRAAPPHTCSAMDGYEGEGVESWLLGDD